MKDMQVAGMTGTPALVNPPPPQAQKAPRQGGGPLHASTISLTMKPMIWGKAMMAQLWVLSFSICLSKTYHHKEEVDYS